MDACPRCGEGNAARARFCAACGQPLAPRYPPAEERKNVSVLFVDLVGFTYRSDEADPEDVRATLRPFHALLKREIERYGGTVEKFIGDAVMAVFGAPIVHEDDPERAVRAALRITEAIAERNLEHADDLAVRAAVTTGEAVVSLEARPELGEGLVAGDVVNTASRLQALAPSGAVVVGEGTYRATRYAIEYAELEPVRVKGKRKRLGIWRAVEARSSLGVDVEHVATPFVGRREELALLQERYLRAIEGRMVQLVLITGEPGVGKTRLGSELRAFVDDRPEIVSWRQGRCLPYGEGVTFWALGEAVKAHAGILESDPPDDAGRKLKEAVAGVADEGDREWLASRLAPLVGIEGDGQTPASRSESFAAWRTFLESVARVRPLVLVLEDLHWADPLLLEFVEELVRFGSEVPLLLVCTARPELHDRVPGWGSETPHTSIVRLAPLSDDETALLIAALLEQAVLPAETQALLLDRAGGNPLYTEEFIRMLVDDDVLRRRGEIWTISTARPIAVPETVQALITARLDRLAPDRKIVLQHAAIVGKVFWSGAVAAMTQLADVTASACLRDLARRDLIRPARRSSVGGQEEYAFRHILIRDVAYGEIPRAARAAGHRAAADWIEGIAADRVADHAELLVHHYERALELSGVASADETRRLEQKATRFLVLAGDRTKHLDLERSHRYYGRALQLMRDDDAARSEVLVKAGMVAMDAGRFREALDLLEHAMDGFRRADNLDGEAWVLAKLHGVVWRIGDGRRAGAIVDRLIDLVRAAPPSPRLAEVYRTIAGAFAVVTEQMTEGLEWSERALALAERFGLREEALMDLQFRGMCRCSLGDAEGLRDLRGALRTSVAGGFAREGTLAHVNAGCWTQFIEGPALALAIYRRGVDYGEGRGQRSYCMSLRAEMTLPLFDLGEWDELIRTVDNVVQWARSAGGSYTAAYALPQKALVLLHRGADNEARSIERELLPIARTIGDPQILVPALSAAALIEASRGDAPGGARLIDQIERGGLDRGQLTLRWILSCLRVLLAAGELDRAAGFLERERARWGRYDQWVPSAEALLAEAREDLASAVGRYREAASRWGAFGNVFDEALAHLGLGRCLLRLGRDGEAVEALQRARAMFGGFGAAALIAEVDRLTAGAQSSRG